MYLLIEFLLGIVVLGFCIGKYFGLFGQVEVRYASPPPKHTKPKKRSRKSVSFSDQCDILEERESAEEGLEISYEIKEEEDEEEEARANKIELGDELNLRLAKQLEELSVLDKVETLIEDDDVLVLSNKASKASERIVEDRVKHKIVHEYDENLIELSKPVPCQAENVSEYPKNVEKDKDILSLSHVASTASERIVENIVTKKTGDIGRNELNCRLTDNAKTRSAEDTKSAYKQYFIKELDEKLKNAGKSESGIDDILVITDNKSESTIVDDQFLQLYKECFEHNKTPSIAEEVIEIKTVDVKPKLENIEVIAEVSQAEQEVVENIPIVTKLKEAFENKLIGRKLIVPEPVEINPSDDFIKVSPRVSPENKIIPVLTKEKGYASIIEQLKARQALRKPIDPDSDQEEDEDIKKDQSPKFSEQTQSEIIYLDQTQHVETVQSRKEDEELPTSEQGGSSTLDALNQFTTKEAYQNISEEIDNNKVIEESDKSTIENANHSKTLEIYDQHKVIDTLKEDGLVQDEDEETKQADVQEKDQSKIEEPGLLLFNTESDVTRAKSEKNNEEEISDVKEHVRDEAAVQSIEDVVLSRSMEDLLAALEEVKFRMT